MATNYFIGIGGTGARVAEAVVHLCAVGYGPDELSLFLIDPDEGNGNLSRTKSLVASYQRCRKRLGERRDEVPLFRTDLTVPDPLVWSVFKERGVTLAEHMNYENLAQTQPPLADFISVLFSEEELRTPLDEGFRGHPAVGAVAMSNPDEEIDPWKTFWEDIENSSQPGEVRTFMAGSIFGGTGAAGVPTFGAPDMIKHHEKASIGDDSKLLLGGALVLPYFTFRTEKVDPSDPQMFVTSADFPIATKAALQFYDEKELAFDQLYFIGDSLAQNVGDFSPGSRTQENRPHYIELSTALAAYDFFEQDPSGRDAREDKYFTAGRTSKTVHWDELPVSRHPNGIKSRQDTLKRRLVTMTAFAYAFLDYGLPILEVPPEDISDPWHRDHFYDTSWVSFGRGTSVDLRQQESKSALKDVGQYAHQFLDWITALDEDDGSVQLVDHDKLIATRSDGEITLLDLDQYEYNLGSFLKEGSDEHGFSAFLNELNALEISSKSMSPSDKFVNLFYEAAQRFCEENYEIAK